MHLRESILRKTADEKAVDAVLDKYRKNNPGQTQLMSNYDVEGYVNHKRHLQKLEAQIAALNKRRQTEGPGKLIKNRDGHLVYPKGSVGHSLPGLYKARSATNKYIDGFKKERELRRTAGMDDTQLETHRATMERIQNVGAKAFMDALPDKYKVEGADLPQEVFDKAKQAAKEASKKAAAEDYGLFSDDLAAQTEKYSAYLDAGGKKSRMNIRDHKLDKAYNIAAMNYKMTQDPDLKKDWQMGKNLVENRGDKAQSANKWHDSLFRPFAEAYGPEEAKNLYKVHAGKNKFRSRLNFAREGRDDKLKSAYVDATKDAKATYNQGRRDKVTGFLKKNWMPIAGLGLGALGVLGMYGMRNKQRPQQVQAAAQPAQQGVDNWAHNRNFRRGTAGTPQQTVIGAQSPGGFDISSTFKKFMGGMSG